MPGCTRASTSAWPRGTSVNKKAPAHCRGLTAIGAGRSESRRRLGAGNTALS
nr:MAG TPA: hypothetical protein [Caudoviricetes sp.]